MLKYYKQTCHHMGHYSCTVGGGVKCPHISFISIAYTHSESLSKLLVECKII